MEIAAVAWPLVMQQMEKHADMVNNLGLVQTDFMGLSRNNKLEFYDGNIRAVDANASQIADFEGKDYLSYIEEMAESYSYMKFTKAQERQRLLQGRPAGTCESRGLHRDAGGR